MKTSEKARRMKVGSFAYFTDRIKANRMYFSLRRACGSKITGHLKIVPSGFRVYKVKV